MSLINVAMNSWERRAAVLAICLVGAIGGAIWATPRAPEATQSGDTQPGAGGRGFAGLGGEAVGFAEVRPGRQFRFPADYGQHPDYRIEWWYITANLYDERGAEFGVQWTLFRQALSPGDVNAKPSAPFDDSSAPKTPWRDRQVWMAHAAATSATEHYFEERFARGGTGQSGVRSAPFEAWLDDWRVSAQGEGIAQLSVAARGERFGFALDLMTSGAIVAQGQGGYHVKSGGRGRPAQASYYFSQPHYRVSGTLNLGGKNRNVQGSAWLDREWSSQPLAPEQIGWDWFSLHFQSGEKMMVYHLRRSDGLPSDLAGTWIDRKGDASHLSADDLELSPLDPRGDDEAPRRWRIAAPQKGFAVSVEPLNPSAQQDSFFPYWEGPIVFSGTHSGRGYLEMTGYRN